MNVSYMIKAVICFVLGLVFLFVPYETFQKWFPKARGVAAVRVAGIVILLGGILFLAISILYSKI